MAEMPLPPWEDIRGIIERQEIAVLYQPIFDLRSRKAHGFEAFARGPWGTPFEQYEPMFQVAGNAGLLPALDRICRRKAILGATHLSAEQKLFVKIYPFLSDHRNRQGENPTSLFDGPVQPQQVVLEISERVAANGFSVTTAMAPWTRIGCSLAVDNFGRGYAGLDKILEMKLRYVKVANALVRDIHTSHVKQEMTSTLRCMAQKFEAQLVVTGIERMEELECVKTLGIQLAQGFLLGKPAPTLESTPLIPL